MGSLNQTRGIDGKMKAEIRAEVEVLRDETGQENTP